MTKPVSVTCLQSTRQTLPKDVLLRRIRLKTVEDPALDGKTGIVTVTLAVRLFYREITFPIEDESIIVDRGCA